MLSSIRLRLTLSHLAVIILAMGLSGFLLLSFLEQYLLETLKDSLTAQAQITAKALNPQATIREPTIEGQAPIQNTIQQGNLSVETQNVLPLTESVDLLLGDAAEASIQLSTQLDTHIRILDAQGVVLFDSLDQENGQNLQADPLVAQALAGQKVSRTDPAGSDQAAMYLAMPVWFKDRQVGVVYLSQSLQDVTAVLRDLRGRWLLPTIIAVILSGLVGLLLSQAIASPLRRLTAAAGAVAQGNLDQQVPVASRDELGRLSLAFNEMTRHLQAARQMQVDFVANVSHELRTPSTSIKGLIETLRDGAVNDLEVRDDFLEAVEAETDRLIRLINDLLLLSRVDSEALQLKRKSIDLRPLIQTTVNQLIPQAEKRNVTLKLSPAQVHAPQPAFVDPDRIEQVIINLLDNAIKYSRPKGTVTISIASSRPSAIIIQVKDEGVGIPADELPKIGQRFYRADKARSRTEGGSGLGLAIACSLVEAHGGQLQLESQEGSGTIATITLPAA
jgi:signal transduction histidine kinase